MAAPPGHTAPADLQNGQPETSTPATQPVGLSGAQQQSGANPSYVVAGLTPDAVFSFMAQQQAMFASQQQALLTALQGSAVNPAPTMTSSAAPPPPPPAYPQHDVSADESSDAEPDADRADDAEFNALVHDLEAGHEQGEPVLDNTDVLAELQHFFAQEDQMGPALPDKIAAIVNKGVRSTFSPEQEKTLCEQFLRPENCQNLVVPRVNKELWLKLRHSTRSRDLKVQKTQNLLLKSIVPIAQLLAAFSTEKDKTNIQLAAKALQLVASASAQLSQHRRDLITPELDPQLKPLSAVSNPITDNLFGDDLAKQVKEIRETQQLGSNVSRPVLRRPDFYRRGGGSLRPRGHGRSPYSKPKPFLGRASQRAPPFHRRKQSHKSSSLSKPRQ